MHNYCYRRRASIDWESAPEAMRAAIKVTDVAGLFSTNLTADDPAEIIARGRNVMSHFSPFSKLGQVPLAAVCSGSSSRAASRTLC